MDTRNTPYSIKRPANWDMIAAYSRGGEKPPEDIARQAFNELIENIKLANCVYFPDVVNSIFRRAPVKIQAENYGHQGYNRSYFVADTAQRSQHYRVNEPVLIELIDFEENQFWSEQFVRLNAGEWVAYTFQDGGLQSGNASLVGMCRELYEHREWLWTFVRCEGVEATNNAGERALRHAVIWRKLSFGTQSAAGSRFVETMLTVIETCRQQHRSAFEYLTAAVHSHLAHKPAPSLLPGV